MAFIFALNHFVFTQDFYSLPVANDSISDTTISIGDSSLAKEDTSLSEDAVNWESLTFRYDVKENRFSLYDKAVLQYKGASLTADTIFLENESQNVLALGKPAIKENTQPDILGYRLKYNHKRQIGEIYYGYTKRDDQTFTGVEVRRQKDGEIFISRGCLAPCEDLSFYFYSRRMVLEPNKKVIARPIVLNISNVPVAVAPMFVVPLGKGRRSGVLRPKMGGDQAQGFFIRDLGYYWAINDYTDLKVNGDLIEGEKGTFDETNLHADYRYNRRDVLSGNLFGRALLKEFDFLRPEWELKFNHKQNLTPDGVQTLSGQGRFVSKPLVLDKSLNEEEAVDQTANANLAYQNQLDWNKARINVSGSQNFNLTTGLLEREFPKASINFSAPLIPTEESDYWDFVNESFELNWYEKINYNYGGDFSSFNKRVPENNGAVGDTSTFIGTRQNLGVNSKYTLLGVFNVIPEAKLTHYWNSHSKSDDGLGKKFRYDLGKAEVGDNLIKTNASISTDTKIFGIAQPNIGKFDKIRHVITPSLKFTYAPEIDTNRNYVSHPKFSVQSFQNKQKSVSGALKNDVDIKIASSDSGKKSQNFKVLSLNSGTGYDFEKRGRKWSDLNSNLSSEIVKNIPIRINFTHRLYNDFATTEEQKNQTTFPILMKYDFGWRKGLKYDGKMNSGLVTEKSPSGEKKYQRNNWSANVNYDFKFAATRVNRAGVFRKDLTHNFSSGLSLSPTAQWSMSYNNRYDFNKGEFSEHKFEFKRTFECWQLDFRWTPTGIAQGWEFKIYVIQLPDIKLESRNQSIRGRK